MNFDRAARLPTPRRAAGPERDVDRVALDEHAKPARLMRGRPILRADPEMIGPGLREFDARGGAIDGLPQAVGQEIGRAHHVRELRVD
ncbi:MAG: hypothetical protein HQ582_27575 [Planctomycetes bacterium]|nr:hypothetical protein [Planctomycetota bacterium]